MEQLPKELLQVIISLLSVEEITRGPLLVCKQWLVQCEDLRKQLLRDHWLKDALPSSVGADGREDKDRPLCAIFNFFKSEVTHFDKFIPFEDEEVPIYLETEDKIKTGVFLLSEAARKYLQEGIHEDDLKDIGGNEASATAFWKAKSAWQGICEEILQYSCPPKVYGKTGCFKSLLQLLTLLRIPGSGITYAENFGEVGHPFTTYGYNEFRAYFLIDMNEAHLFFPFAINYSTEHHVAVCVRLFKEERIIQ